MSAFSSSKVFEFKFGIFLVVEDDQQYSPARIAGKNRIQFSLAEGEQQHPLICSSPSATDFYPLLS